MKEVNSGESVIQLFNNYLSDPAKAGSGNPAELKAILDQYPYCQLLHLFYTHNLSSAGDEGYQKQLEQAALFIPTRSKIASILKISDRPESLKRDSPEAEITEEATREESARIDEMNPESADTNQQNAAESGSVQAEINPSEFVVPEEEKTNVIAEEDQKKEADHSWDAKKVEEPADDRQEQNKKEPEKEKPTQSREDFIENIFNQIIGAVPPPDNSEPVFKNDEAPKPKESKSEEVIENEVNKKDPDLQTQNTTKVPEQKPTERIIHNEAEMVQPVSAIVPDAELSPEAEETRPSATNDQKISKYDDDKMPYSFLWWLNKTRKEHADTYQPYVEFKLDTSQKIKKTTVDQLSSQIIENIFHLQSPLDDLENAPRTVPFQVRHKEDSILEKFIKEEPQIRPPDSHKLDTENKARKSAEDPNDLVSETLAQIYTDQMLFQKAIDTYKKLSLKFPEKSTYFAVQIRELEKKVN